VNRSKLSPGVLSVILVAVFVGLALFIRVYYPFDRVFTPDWIKLTGADAYFHMRLVDNLVHNFPHLLTFDPYMIYPGGAGVGNIRFFDWLLAGIIWIIGLGSPTQHTIDVVGVYYPAILGALTVIPVYFIGKELFGRWAGIIAAALLAILPGEFLGRSILGFTDHHVAEALFSTITILFLILAVKTAGQRRLTLHHLWQKNWAITTRPLIYSLLAGVFLGIYILTFRGALLFVFIISVYLIIQSVINHLRRNSIDYLGIIGVGLFFTALVISLLVYRQALYLVPMVGALFIPLILIGISRLMKKKTVKPAYYPVTLLVLGLAGLGLFYLVNPDVLSAMLNLFNVFIPTGAQLTTIEMQAFFRPVNGNPLVLAWGNFTTSFFLVWGFFLILILYMIIKRGGSKEIWRVIKQGGADKTLLVVWSLVIMAATAGQRRFAYYLAVNVALVTGYLSWLALRQVGLRETSVEPAKIAKGTGRKKARPKGDGFRITISQINVSLGVLIVLLIVFLPNFVNVVPNTGSVVGPTIATASRARFAPSDAWCNSLSWLRENTPEPFGDPEFYNELHRLPPTGERYEFPESAYGVTAWWDYGYWITRIARRIPSVNPSQDPEAITSVAKFFTSQDESSASKLTEELGAPYVVIDYDTTVSKFWAIALWSGREHTDYVDIYWVQQDNQLQSIPLFHTEYYRALCNRLYNFDGKAVTPENVLVVSYTEQVTKEGTLLKIITSAEQFGNYDDAEAYLLEQESDDYMIVGTNPLVSPVPLEALSNYKLIHSSDEGVSHQDVGIVSEVKIFEYVGGGSEAN